MILCTLLPDQNLKLWRVSDTAKTRSRTVKREAAAWGGGGGKGVLDFTLLVSVFGIHLGQGGIRA